MGYYSLIDHTLELEIALTIFNAFPTLLAVTIKEANSGSDLCEFWDLLFSVFPGNCQELTKFSVWEHTWQSSWNRRIEVDNNWVTQSFKDLFDS